jgi:hypothetical protein
LAVQYWSVGVATLITTVITNFYYSYKLRKNVRRCN